MVAIGGASPVVAGKSRTIPRRRPSGLLRTGLIGYWPFSEDVSDSTKVFDRSGNGNHATFGGSPYTPTWHASGKGAVFATSAKLIEFPTSVVSARRSEIVILSVAPQAAAFQAPWYGETIDAHGRFYGPDGGGANPIMTPSETMQGNICYGATYGAGGRMYLMDHEVHAYVKRNTFTPHTYSPNVNWMGCVSGPVMPYYGTAWMRAIWNVQLSSEDILEQMAVLIGRVQSWGITVSNTLTDVPQIVCFGDSMTGAFLSTTESSYPRILDQQLANNVRITNLGVATEQAADIGAAVPSRWNTTLSALTTECIGVLMCGTNDRLLATTPEDSIADTETAIANMYAAGCTKVVVITPPRGDWEYSAGNTQAQGDADHQEFCDWIIGGGPDCDAVVDLTTDTHLGYSGDYTSSTYYRDDLHLKDAGHTIIATQLEAQALNGLGIT